MSIFPFSNILYRDEKDITRQSETSECFSFVCKLPKVGGPHHINPGTLNANSVRDGHSNGYQNLQLLRAVVRQGLFWYVGVLLVQCTPYSNPLFLLSECTKKLYNFISSVLFIVVISHLTLRTYWKRYFLDIQNGEIYVYFQTLLQVQKKSICCLA